MVGYKATHGKKQVVIRGCQSWRWCYQVYDDGKLIESVGTWDALPQIKKELYKVHNIPTKFYKRFTY